MRRWFSCRVDVVYTELLVLGKRASTSSHESTPLAKKTIILEGVVGAGLRRQFSLSQAWGFPEVVIPPAKKSLCHSCVISHSSLPPGLRATVPFL